MFSTPRKPLIKSLLPRDSHPVNHIPTITLAADEDDDAYLSTCSSSTLSSASSGSPSPMAQKRRSPPPSPPPRKKVVIEISDDDEHEGDERGKELKGEAPPASPLQKRPVPVSVPVPVPAAVPVSIRNAERAVVRARLNELFTHIAAGSSLATANRAITVIASPALPAPAERWPLKNTTTTTTPATTTAGASVGTPKNPTIILTSSLPRAKHEQQTSPAAVNIAPEAAVGVLADLLTSARPNAWIRPHTASRGLRAPLTSQLLAITSSPPFSIMSTPAPPAAYSAQPAVAAAATTPPKAFTFSSSPGFEIPSSPPPRSGTGLPPYELIDKTARSVQRLQIAIRKVLDEAGEDVVKRLAKELRHDWGVDEMAIFVEGYLRGALHEKIMADVM